MISIIFGIVIMGLVLFWIRSSYYAKRLTEMKDGQAKEKIVSNKNIANSGLLQYYVYPTLIFAFFAIIYFIF